MAPRPARSVPELSAHRAALGCGVSLQGCDLQGSLFCPSLPPNPRPGFLFLALELASGCPCLSQRQSRLSACALVDGWRSGRQTLPEEPRWESIFRALSGGSPRPRCFQKLVLGKEASRSPPTFALVSVSLGLDLGTEGSRCAPRSTSTLALSFDFLLKVIESIGVRTVAFPFIPPLDVTLNRVHFLLSDAPSPDTRRQMFAVVSEERPLPLLLPPPNLMRRS